MNVSTKSCLFLLVEKDTFGFHTLVIVNVTLSYQLVVIRSDEIIWCLCTVKGVIDVTRISVFVSYCYLVGDSGFHGLV